VWLQLRPQTLIDRYFDSNRKANQRIRDELGDAASIYNITQKIIFGSQKRCWPWTENDPPCYAVPESNLPKDVYGPDTDTDVGFEPNPYLKFRPRYINSGVIIGTVGAMKDMFAQALELLTSDVLESNMGSDQYVFSHIFGDQEVWREVVRRKHLTSAQQLKEKALGYTPRHPFQAQHLVEVASKAAARPDGRWEFGIGLDYEMSIGLNTVFSEDDTEWLTWNDRKALDGAEAHVGVPATHPRHLSDHPLSPDITSTVPPFYTFWPDARLPARNTSWSDVPLFTNVWTGIVPVAIHNNAHRDGRKALRESWWDRLWFQPSARALYDAHVWEPIVPIAWSGDADAGFREYWPVERWKGGARDGPLVIDDPADGHLGGWLPFADLCNNYTEEVFRDGLGPWILPDVH
jgi:hypothetical protein